MAKPVHDIDAHLGDFYTEVDQDVTRVHAYWKLLLQLFGTRESVDALNRAAGFAIRAIQDSLTDSVLLRITKLTDPATSQGGRFENLSLANLIDKLPADADSALINTLRHQLQQIQDATDAFRVIRHKRLAHRDSTYVIDPMHVLPGLSKQKIDVTLELFRNFMHEIQRYYGYEGTVYHLVELGRDGDHLIFHLLCGSKFIELHEAMSLGELTDSEVRQRVKELPKRNESAV
jgi:AbiU2